MRIEVVSPGGDPVLLVELSLWPRESGGAFSVALGAQLVLRVFSPSRSFCAALFGVVDGGVLWWWRMGGVWRCLGGVWGVFGGAFRGERLVAAG